jgi:hypothetical protein
MPDCVPPRTEHDVYEPCRALAELRETFARLRDELGRAPGYTIRAARAEVRAFCQRAHAQRVPGIEVRRQVGSAMLAARTRRPGGAPLGAWKRAAQRLVDEIYLLGEHRV